MIYYGKIDYLRKTTTLERKSYTVNVNLKKTPVIIDRIQVAWLLEKRKRRISIERSKYKILTINIPMYSDWVILHNDYLPVQGEYFLN